MTSTPPAALPPDYYLHNFLCLLEQVQSQYEDLLLPEELELCRRFPQLSTDARKLYVRLLTRKGDLFRAGQLKYPEIKAPKQAAQGLADQQLIAIDPELPLQDLLPLWNKNEWLERLRRAGISTRGLQSLKRAELDAALLELSDVLEGQHSEESLYQLLNPQIFTVFKLLFFGNPYQDLTDFVLRDLGLYRYEEYRLDRQTRLFQSREQIDLHLACQILAEELEMVLLSDRETMLDFAGRIPPVPADDPALNRRVQRMSYNLARQLEREGHWDEALEIYQVLDSEDARERQIRLLAKTGREAEALNFCSELLPQQDHSQHFPWRFGQRLARQLEQPWPARPGHQPPTQTLELPFTGASVEQAVAEALAEDGTCHYVENTLVVGLFGLHYWPAIFAPVAGAFSHPFQYAPHDLYHPEFNQRRAALLDTCHAQVPTMSARTADYLQLWRSCNGCLNPFVNWQVLDETLLDMALARIPPEHWQALFSHIWRDLKNHCAGLPDLIHFPEAGGYELVEVKGPGDRLQQNQRVWMECFARHGIAHRVIHVSWRHD